MIRGTVALLLISLSIACASTPETPSQRLSDDYETLEGDLINARLEDGDNVLVVYIDIDLDKDSQKIVRAVVYNNEEEWILSKIMSVSKQERRRVTLFGDEISGPWREWEHGLIFEFYYIAHYDDISDDWVITRADYGMRTKDTTRNLTLRGFIRGLAGLSGKTVKKGASKAVGF